MAISPEEFTELRAYMGASRELIGWIDGARAFALLRGAHETGLLSALQTWCTAAELASATGITEPDVVDICLALCEYGVVERAGESYQLTPDYARLASPRAAVPLPNVIDQGAVMIRALQAVPHDGGAYTTLPPEDVLTLAQGAGISALSTSPRVGQAAVGQAMPEVAALWRAGAHHLEVGCGVGNSLMGTALAYPAVSAVGIEISEVTAAETKRRIHQLGLAERVTVRTMDASDLDDRESFDTIQWSQFFFPTASRPVVLRAMHRALKPGGYLFMPWLGSVSPDSMPHRGQMALMALRALWSGGLATLPFLNDLLGDTPGRRKRERRFSALQRLLFHRWGVPVRGVTELEEEVAGSGFTVIRTMRVPASQFALTRGFLLAQRPPGQ